MASRLAIYLLLGGVAVAAAAVVLGSSSGEPSSGGGSAEPLRYNEIVMGADPGAPLPMVVVLHGMGSNPGRIVEQLALHSVEGARIIVPYGFEKAGDGYRWFPFRSRDSQLDALSQALASAADRMAVGVRKLLADLPTVGKPTLVGYSQGGLMAFALAVRHPDLFGVVVPIAGWLPPPLMPSAAPADAPSIEAMHGTKDPTVPFEPTEVAVTELAALGWPADLTPHPGVAHTVSKGMRNDLRDRLEALIAQVAA
jgi:phospholipase/carboxylesterase